MCLSPSLNGHQVWFDVTHQVIQLQATSLLVSGHGVSTLGGHFWEVGKPVLDEHSLEMGLGESIPLPC